jgi:hypothetical protein
MVKTSFAVIALIYFLCIPAPAFASDWVLYGRPDSGSMVAYYDRENVVPFGDKMLRVTVKYEYSEQGKKEVITSRKRSELPIDGYEKLVHSIVLYELDCGTSKQAIFAVNEIAADGKELDHYNAPTRTWTPIKQGGIGEALLKKVCK